VIANHCPEAHVITHTLRACLQLLYKTGVERVQRVYRPHPLSNTERVMMASVESLYRLGGIATDHKGQSRVHAPVFGLWTRWFMDYGLCSMDYQLWCMDR
jgi:hypothetical protein